MKVLLWKLVQVVVHQLYFLKGCTFTGCSISFSGPSTNVNNESVAAEANVNNESVAAEVLEGLTVVDDC